VGIPEAQLTTWTAQGSITQSANTYQTIKGTLESQSSPYWPKANFDSFLQGSYGNDTNVYADSDVDIVMRTDSIYFHDIGDLPQPQQTAFNSGFVAATYTYQQFRADVTNWLDQKYGPLTPGQKAIPIPPNGARRKADVVVAAQLRRYTSYISASNNHYHEGICIITPNGLRIENFPKQHSANCTTKNLNTNGRFKPTVRMFKNIRNRMVADGIITKAVAPSYFIEGALWNVPNNNFVSSNVDTFVNCWTWLNQADATTLTTASGLHRLVLDGHSVCWPTANFAAFLTGSAKLWNDWT
jgi:hypothetical protein